MMETFLTISGAVVWLVIVVAGALWAAGVLGISFENHTRK